MMKATLGIRLPEWDCDCSVSWWSELEKSHTAPISNHLSVDIVHIIPIKVLSSEVPHYVYWQFSGHSVGFIFLQISLFWIFYKFLPNIRYPTSPALQKVAEALHRNMLGEIWKNIKA